MSKSKEAPAEIIDAPAIIEMEAVDPPKESPVGSADYDWSQHYDTTDLYVHTFPDGKVVALRPFPAIYSKTWLYKIRNLQTDVDFQFAAIDKAACETAQQVLESLDDESGDPIKDLFEAWTADGTKRSKDDEGLTPGN